MLSLTYDQTFLAAVIISSIVMVLSAVWIVLILISIEKTKVVALSTVLEDDGTGTCDGGDLQFEESTATRGKNQLEIELPEKQSQKQNSSIDLDNGDAAGVDEITPSRPKSRSPTRRERGVVKPPSPSSFKKRHHRKRRVSGMFVAIQCLSVSVLSFLTYLLLVVSTAPIALRILGSLCVFGMFLRYQIGDEIRRQRVDRLMLLLSLFLVIASMISTIVYSMKSLSQGEIYEGPARIVGFDTEQYNNTQHDPTTRTDIAVSWGKNWGCPLTGGKVCQTRIKGTMCQTHPDKKQTKHKPNYDSTRSLKNENDDDGDDDDDDDESGMEKQAEEDEVEDLEEDLEDEEKSDQNLENQNESLEKENEELKEEIEELKEGNEIVDEEEDELIDEENAELDEMADEYDEDLMIIEEEEYEQAQDYVDAEYELDEESIEEKIESTDDDTAEEELEEELEEDNETEEDLDEEYEEDEEYFDEYADEFDEASAEEAENFEEAVEEVEEEEGEKNEIEEEIEETEAEIDDTDKKVDHKGQPTKKKESNDDIYEEMAEDVYEEEEEEIEEEYEDEEYDEWYWDEYPDSYYDDFYEDEYWDYDWDSVWGDYACEDLFASDVGSRTYDVNTPAGGDDEWPFVIIYGSCKTCEAYILDYFAEEAFEEVEEYKQQAIVYLAGALAGFIWAILAYVKYRVMPTAENEIELLGNDGGVMA